MPPSYQILLLHVILSANYHVHVYYTCVHVLDTCFEYLVSVMNSIVSVQYKISL